MFDKVIIKGKVDAEDIETIVLKNYLEQCTRGDEVSYTSTAYANFDGVFITLNGNTLKCKCSINKLWQKAQTGKLDNSKPMTFRNAVKTIKELLLRLCLKAEDCVVTYYEIGLTMRLKNPATVYIGMMEEVDGKLLWNDANYPENRQKTTERSKYYRKILKVYDKTFEAGEKGRHVADNVLRIETIYRHQSVKLPDLLDEANLHKIGKVFYEDWQNVKFEREITALPGVRLSQLSKAREVQRIGIERYIDKYRTMYQGNKLSKKQWETIRNFARAWPEQKKNFIETITPFEDEYKEVLLSGYQVGSIVFCKSNLKR